MSNWVSKLELASQSLESVAPFLKHDCFKMTISCNVSR